MSETTQDPFDDLLPDIISSRKKKKSNYASLVSKHSSLGGCQAIVRKHRGTQKDNMHQKVHFSLAFTIVKLTQCGGTLTSTGSFILRDSRRH